MCVLYKNNIRAHHACAVAWSSRGAWFRNVGLGFRVRVEGSQLRISGLVSRVSNLVFRVSCPGLAFLVGVLRPTVGNTVGPRAPYFQFSTL